MLTKLFGKKPDHPMAGVKSAQAVLNCLPRNDAFRSAMELTDWIETVAGCSSSNLIGRQLSDACLAFMHFKLRFLKADTRDYLLTRLCCPWRMSWRQAALRYIPELCVSRYSWRAH